MAWHRFLFTNVHPKQSLRYSLFSRKRKLCSGNDKRNNENANIISKKTGDQVEKKEITQIDSFSLSSRAKYLQEQFESIDGYKLQKDIEFVRDKVKKKAKQEFDNIFPAERLQAFKEQSEQSNLVMDSKWWCWNLALACVPGLLLAAICESLRPALDRDMEKSMEK